MLRAELLNVADTEAVVRRFLRQQGLAGGRVFFDLPATPQYPAVTIARVGGTEDGDMPWSSALISHSVWSDQGKRSASSVTAALVGLIKAVASHDVTLTDGATARIEDASVSVGPLWRPDAPAGLARYVVDAVYTIRPRT